MEFGQLEKCTDLLVDGIERNDSDVQLLMLAAGLYCLVDNYDSAIPLYERVLEVDSLHQEARKRLYLIETDQMKEYLDRI